MTAHCFEGESHFLPSPVTPCQTGLSFDVGRWPEHAQRLDHSSVPKQVGELQEAHHEGI